MRTSKRLIGFILSFVVVVVVLSLCFTPPSGIRLLMHEAKDTKYDTIILGQSHGECGYNPYIISDELGCEAMVVSRRLTPLNNMYYILKEINKDNHIKTVILDIDPYYWRLGQNRDYGTDMDLFYRLSGLNRWEYFKDVIWGDQFMRLFCDYYISLENIKLIPKALKAKFNKEYILNEDSAMVYVDEYLKSDNAYEYKGRGYLYGVNRAPELGWEIWQFDNDVTEENLQSFRDINEYCNQNGISLICVQSALTPTRLHQQNMGDVHDYFTNLCDLYNIDFYDFNYAKKEYLNRTELDYVDADGHPMGELSDRQTKLLCELVKSSNKGEFLYNDYSEVLINY